MTYKAAVASTDGKVVNQHFGRADLFHIVEISSEGYSYLESRSINACCNNGNHETASFVKAAEALKDVSAIIVSRIGEGAADFLEANGFIVYEAPFPIEPLLQKIVEDKLYEVDKWQFHTKN